MHTRSTCPQLLSQLLVVYQSLPVSGLSVSTSQHIKPQLKTLNRASFKDIAGLKAYVYQLLYYGLHYQDGRELPYGW